MTVTVLGWRLPAVVTYVVALGLSLVLMLLTSKICRDLADQSRR